MKAIRIVVLVALVAVGVGGAATPKLPITWQTVAWGKFPATSPRVPCGQTWAREQPPRPPCSVIVSSGTGPTANAVANTGGDGNLVKHLRAVDYNRFLVVVVFSDPRPSGMDQIEVRSIRQTGRTLNVGTVITPCGSPFSLVCSTDFVYVFHAVKVPKASLIKPYPNGALVQPWIRPPT